MLTARITSRGQITIPREVRERLRLQPGDSLEFQFTGNMLAVKPVHQKNLNEFRGLFPTTHTIKFSEEREQAWSERARELTEHDA